MLNEIRRHSERMTSRQRDFLSSLESRAANDEGLTEKQIEWLSDLAIKLPNQPDLDEVKEGLVDRCEDLFRELFGEPSKRSIRRSQWEWDSSGGQFAVVRSGNGKRRGDFYVHRDMVGGGPLDAIMYARSCSFGDAVGWACHWLGFDAPGYTPKPVDEATFAERARRREEQEREADDYRRKRTETAARIWSETVELGDTLGAIYLAKRAIEIPTPLDAVRWHPRRGSVVVAATRDDGTVQAIQEIYIGADGRKVSSEEIERRALRAVKVTTGPADGAAVRLPGPAAGPLLLCEGPETGLSAWLATGHETWVALGQLAKLTPPCGRVIVLCRDDDRKPKPGHKGPTAEDRHRKLTAELRSRGLQVVTALPWTDRQFDGSDFNDLLILHGAEAVAARINTAIPPDLPPEYEPATHTLDEARAILDPEIVEFSLLAIQANAVIDAFHAQRKEAEREIKTLGISAETLDEPTPYQRERIAELRAIIAAAPPPAPHHGLKVGLGIGKTHAAAEALPTYLANARARGVTSGIIWTAPTLDLADQTATMARERGVSVGVYRGRRAPNPDAPVPPKNDSDDAGRMCLDLPAVKLAHDAGANVAESVCGNERGEDHERCVHFATCPFQTNNRSLRDKDVVFAAHNALLQELPSKVEAGRGLTVIDEAFWQSGLTSSELAVDYLTADLQEAPILRDGEPDDFGTERLRSTMTALSVALQRHDDGTPISATTLREAGLEADRCREASREHWRRMIPLDMRPGMPIEDRRAASRMAVTNRRVPAMARLVKLAADILDGDPGAAGRLEMSTADLKAGPERRVIAHHIKGMVKARLERPILHLDATMPLRAVRQYLPAMKLAAEVDAVTPHMRLVQILSTRENRGGWGKNAVIPDEAPDEGEKNRREWRPWRGNRPTRRIASRLGSRPNRHLQGVARKVPWSGRLGRRSLQRGRRVERSRKNGIRRRDRPPDARSQSDGCNRQATLWPLVGARKPD